MSQGMRMVVGAIVGALVGAIVGLVLYAAVGAYDPTNLHSTWPKSAEFSQIMTGGERFSEHATNVEDLIVVVDHETGVQYLAGGHGMTALLDADGTPLRVKEAA